MLLGFILFLTTLATCYLVFNPPAWFPVAITPLALAYDSQFTWTLRVTGILFIAAQLILAWIILRKRPVPFKTPGALANKRTVSPEQPGLRASLLATAAMIAVEAALAAHGAHSLTSPQPQAPETIEVYAHQFAWNFRYAGADGVFGRVKTEFIAYAAGNPVGLDPSDSRGKDDIVTSTLRIPAGRDVRLLLHSQDVIHDFFVRELRTKQDVVPGQVIPLDIHADRPGQYEIACAELCGLAHNQMHGILLVMPSAEYDIWKNDPEKRNPERTR
jgi:cytochrome c oxidase subunit 2